MKLKNNIFIKIYLWFWVTTALIMSTQMLIDRLTDSGPFTNYLHTVFTNNITMYSGLIADYKSKNDELAIQKLIQKIKEISKTEFYCIEADKIDSIKLPIIDKAKPIINKVLNRNDTLEIFLADGNIYTGINLTGTNNKKYIVLSETLPLPPPIGRHPRETKEHTIRMFIGLIISAIICYLIARYFTQPIFIINKATCKFAAGNLSTRIAKDINRTDEFYVLANSFDNMAEKIELLMNSQKQLLGDISHELRSPLARLNVALELIRKQFGDSASKNINRIEKEVEALNLMIEKVLELTKLECGVKEISKSKFQLDKLLKKIIADGNFEAEAIQKSVTLISSEECFIVGNEELLKRALENLIRNAIKYTKENTTVEIFMKKSIYNLKSAVEIIVKDHGPGVNESELTNIFKPFYRLSGARERSSGGVGLGLAITERAISFHNGTVKAFNEKDGGLQVQILLPLE
ncbi:MAG: ATP-binding protein [Candidatus Wallbacteria bacterium]